MTLIVMRAISPDGFPSSRILRAVAGEECASSRMQPLKKSASGLGLSIKFDYGGGVLEHPAESTLFTHCRMPKPGEFADRFGGYTVAIEQFHWGHRAEKATWLYIVGCHPSLIPVMPRRPGRPTHCIRPTKNYPRLPSVTKPEREHTPPALAEWLIELARRCKMPQAVAA